MITAGPSPWQLGKLPLLMKETRLTEDFLQVDLVFHRLLPLLPHIFQIVLNWKIIQEDCDAALELNVYVIACKIIIGSNNESVEEQLGTTWGTVSCLRIRGNWFHQSRGRWYKSQPESADFFRHNKPRWKYSTIWTVITSCTISPY